MKTLNRILTYTTAIPALAIMSATCTFASTQPYQRQAISNLHVNDFAQDEMGFMWIATANGLSRCNGLEGYDIYYNDPANPESLPNNQVTALTVTDGKLWIATNGGVASKPTGSNTFTCYTPADNPADIIAAGGFITYGGKMFCYGTKGLYEIDTIENKLHKRVALNKTVRAAHDDNNGRLWIIDDNNLICCNKELKPIETVKFPAGTSVNKMTRHGKTIFITTDCGILRLDTNSKTLKHDNLDSSLKNEKIYNLTPVNDTLFLATTATNGLIAYNPTNGRTTTHINGTRLSDIPSNDVTTTYIDRDKNLWVGTFNKGYTIFSNRPRIFNMNHELCDIFTDKFVTRITNDRQDRFWVGTRYNGLACFDPNSGKSREFNSRNTQWLAKYPMDFVQEIFCDSRNRLWIGYNNNLVICQIQPDGTLTHLHSLPSVTDVVSAAEDDEGRIWLGLTRKGLYVFSPDLKLTANVNLPHAENITSIRRFDKSHMLFSAYGTGLYTINTKTMTAEPFDREQTKDCINAIDLLLADNGQLWIGTYGSGVFSYDLDKRAIHSYNGLLSNDIVALLEDSDHNIFMSSSYGLYRYDPQTEKLTTYLETQGTLGNQYHEKSRHIDKYGNLYFGGNSGLQQVVPANMLKKTDDTPLYLTNVELLTNKNSNTPNRYTPDYSTINEMSLGHKDNSIRLEFAGITYDSPLEYAYKLDGFDKDWIMSGNHNQALYSNLPAGHYKLLVKSRYDNEWSHPVKLLQLTISPSPWLHPMAKAAYVVVILMLIILFNHLYLRIRLERRRYMMAEEQVLKERDSTQRKINFFNNLSHEIRTPISLIYAPVKYLHSNIESLTSEKVKSTLDYIDRNVDRLLNLTNQLLKFHEVQQDTLPLKVGRYDCVAQLEAIVRIYNIYAAEKGQSVEFVSPYKSYECTYDYDKLEKIVNNLLFNATKYTPENGNIIVKLEITKLPEGFNKATDYNYMEIQVIDDGIGMSHAEMPRIFQRFKRLMGCSAKDKINGYGVGLSYVKELVACHKGTITPRCNPIKGMTFIVAIPVDDAAFSSDEHKTEADIKDTDKQLTTKPVTNTDTADMPESDEADKPRILLVEDNEELLEFEAAMFRGKYEVFTATNGLQGLEIARKEMPNVVISDILMPQMDGYDLCRHIKTDMDTCHISVILLTAKTMDEDRITGFKVGADMYIDKPFNPEIIQSVVENIIAKQERNKINIINTTADSSKQLEEEEDLNPLDRKFLSKLYSYINENMSNSELNVNILGKDLGFSRTNFYRKIKMLTGVTPNDLLRMCRLNRAAELLLTKQHTIGEISDICGFGTQSHFSSLFKKHFGVSPRDYIGGGPKE